MSSWVMASKLARIFGTGRPRRGGPADPGEAGCPASAQDDFRAYVAVVAHDLRTPLSAMAGEVELALRRDRSPEAYRDALARIGAGVEELIDLTADIALLAGDAVPAAVARLDVLLASLTSHYDRRAPGRVAFQTDARACHVVGAPRLIERALVLLIEDTLRSGNPGELVTVRTAASSDRDDVVRLTIDARPKGGGEGGSGIGDRGSGNASAGLAAAPRRAADGVQPDADLAPVSLRFRAAAHIIRQYGGAVGITRGRDVTSIDIRLRCAPATVEPSHAD